ncbi:MAG: ABC transporter ATP-binding protein [Longimicrobiales bacterium]
MNQTPALQVTKLRKRYRDFELKEVSFSLPTGYVLGLVGPNGAGKTTIIKLIMNLIRPVSGTIRVFGMDHRAQEAEVKARMGWVYDVPPLYHDVTLHDTKRAISIFYPGWNEVLFQELASQFQLPLKKKVKALSHGMRTKFSLALALSHDADLLVLDEPTTGLDPVFRRELLHGLSGLLEDETKSILFSTHITTDLERIADYVICLRDGAVILDTTREALQTDWAVVRGEADDMKALDPAICVGSRQHAHGVDLLTSDAETARATLGGRAVVDPASFEDIVFLMGKGEHHA